MFNIGDNVMYKSAGVCLVREITKIDKSGRDYYVLQPYFGSETIYAPVDTKVFMRACLTADEARELILKIPQIETEPCNDKNFLTMREHYNKSISSNETKDLIQLIKGIYEKGCRKKLGTVDERYMKRAEDLLYGELAIALGISRDDVIDYIRKTLEDTEN